MRLNILDDIEACRWELHALGVSRVHKRADDKPNPWQVLDAAERAYNEGDLQTAGVMLAYADNLIGQISASAPAKFKRQAKARRAAAWVMARWQQVGKDYPSRNAFASAHKSKGLSDRVILRILKERLGKHTRHTGRPPSK